jgi:protein-disulfide isomerase
MKPTSYLACALAVVAVAGCNSKQGDAATNVPVNVKPVAPPKGGDWTEIVSATAQGGFLMGNPAAKLKLVEYGSLTCPHCREFDEKGVPLLISKYVKTGQVSWEFRNYVRDAFDLTASLIARCNGAKSFFPLSRAFYKDQPTWVAKIQTTPPAQLEQLQNLPPNRQFLEMAKIAGFQQWAAARGVPVTKSTQCLTDENSVNQLVQMTSDATTQYPDFAGTPTFVLNDKMLEKTATWELLEPQLRSALGG